MLCAAAVFAVVATPAPAADAVVVASKIDTEGALLGQLVAAVIERQGVRVERRIALGPTNIVRAAILAGQIDVYPEYTGNGALFFHREDDPAWRDTAKGYALVAALDKRENHLVWLTPAPADNSWVIAIRRDQLGFPPHPRGVGRVRREPGGAARFRNGVWVSFVGRPAVDLVGWQHRGDPARRRRGHLWGQRGDGLRH
jgi:osmoprotectant transport system substrate-binding protein